ncbi:MAG: DnaJ like chaperone protein [Methylophagaceae bacterium]
MFKYILAFAGFYISGFILALLGYFIGGVIDRAQSLGLGAINPLANGQRKLVFLETTFLLMGKLAKVDGHISKNEINHVEDFIQKMDMSSEHRQQAINQFKLGSVSDFNFDQTLNAFMEHCGQTLHLKQVLLMYLIVMAAADGQVDAAEQAFLKQVANRLGYSDIEFQQMLDMVLNQSHFGQGSPTSASSLDDAYKALGVTADQSDQEIKRAYRKLMSQYHPDKLIGQGLPEDMIKVATEQAKEIQVAYDLIKKQRETR